MTPIKTAETPTLRKDVNNFDILRLLFASLVVFSHSYVLSGKGSPDPLDLITHHQADLGAISVDCFFIISGYLITASWIYSANLFQFLQKRILRIYPGFLVVCLICTVVVAPMLCVAPTAYFHHLHPAQVILHMFLLDKIVLPIVSRLFSSPVQVDGSLWSIKIEFECYLLVAVFGLAGLYKRRGVVTGIGIVTLLLFVISPFAQGHIGRILNGYAVADHLRMGYYFISGMTCYLYRDNIKYTRTAAAIVVALGVVTVLVGLFRSFLPIGLPYVLMVAAFGKHFPVEKLTKKCDLSYGIYLYAWPIGMLIENAFRNLLPPIPLFLLTYPLCAFAALLSWILVEGPCLKLKPPPMPGTAVVTSTTNPHLPVEAG